jgi:hypothetical protein
MRSVAGVIVGYLVFAVSALLIFRISGHDPHEPATTAFMVEAIAAGMVAALIGGYVAVMIAARQRAATELALVIAVLAVLSAASMHGRSLWSNIAAVVLMAPAAKLGGALAKRRA